MVWRSNGRFANIFTNKHKLWIHQRGSLDEREGWTWWGQGIEKHVIAFSILLRNLELNRMNTCSLRGCNSEDTAYFGPDGWHELCPLSDVKVARTPNIEIKVEMKALTQTSIEMENKGTASGHRVFLSIIVKMYE